jgi:hypothetical protein
VIAFSHSAIHLRISVAVPNYPQSLSLIAEPEAATGNLQHDMPDSREEKRAITAFLNTQQDRIYNLWALQGLTIDEIHRELVWNLKLGWVR